MDTFWTYYWRKGLKKPIPLKITYEDEVWLLENEYLGMVGAGRTVQDAWKDLELILDSLLEGYLMENDCNLSSDALELKSRLKEFVGGQCMRVIKYLKNGFFHRKIGNRVSIFCPKCKAFLGEWDSKDIICDSCDHYSLVELKQSEMDFSVIGNYYNSSRIVYRERHKTGKYIVIVEKR